MNSLTDQQLLRDYSGQRSETAFSELARRHVDLVYSAALRMVRDPHLAEDVSQAVFVALAKDAAQLADRLVLSGWLHRTTQNLAANVVRTEVRRRAREQEAVAMNELLAHEPDATWENIAPHLDTALGELSELDRDALLLRYFERRSAREMAQTLNVSEEAAQKRVNRAVERLREFFSKRNVTIASSGLVVLISTNAVHAAPIGLIVTITSAISLAGTAVQTSTAIAAIKTIAMTALQKSLITTMIVVATGAGIYQARHASNLKREIQSFGRKQGTLTEQIEQLQRERNEAENRLASLTDEIAKEKSNFAELLKLRNEVGTLRQQKAIQANSPKDNETQTLNKGFGALGEYLPAEKMFDAGNQTAEALLQTFIWAVREGNIERLEQIGGPFGGQSEVGDVVGELSKSQRAIFETIQNVFTNAAGFRLSSQDEADGSEIKVRLDTVPMSGVSNNAFVKNFYMSFLLEKKQKGWGFGDPSKQ